MARGNSFPRRRSIRLREFDYARSRAYFITVCIENAEPRLCDISSDGRSELTYAGLSVDACWRALPLRFKRVQLDAFVVMPDHIHGILFLQPQGATEGKARIGLGTVVGCFKSTTAIRYIRGVRDSGWAPFRKRFWQRNYFEHIVRSPNSLARIRRYIADNPVAWARESPHRRNEESLRALIDELARSEEDDPNA